MYSLYAWNICTLQWLSYTSFVISQLLTNIVKVKKLRINTVQKKYPNPLTVVNRLLLFTSPQSLHSLYDGVNRKKCSGLRHKTMKNTPTCSHLGTTITFFNNILQRKYHISINCSFLIIVIHTRIKRSIRVKIIQ